MKIKNLFLLAALGLMASATLTSCEDVLGHWEKPSPNPITPGGGTPVTPEEIYAFSLRNMADDADITATAFNVTDQDGNTIVTAESDGKYTIKSGELSSVTTLWLEATTATGKYIAKATKEELSAIAEAGKLKMATLGDVILSDGKFAAAEATGAVAKICYLGSETAEAANGFNHGLALAMSDANGGSTCKWKTSKTDAGHTPQTSSTFTEESGLQYNSFTPDHNTSDYPAFQAAITYSPAAPTGCSAWFLASGYQWKQMLGANGYGLANLTTTANGYTGLYGYYWSSTEYDASYAWDLYYYNGNCNKVFKTDDYHVRACLAF